MTRSRSRRSRAAEAAILAIVLAFGAWFLVATAIVAIRKAVGW